MLCFWPLHPQSLSECDDGNYAEFADYTLEEFTGTVHFVDHDNVRFLCERLATAVWNIFSEAFRRKFSFFCICPFFFFVHSSENCNEL